MMRTAEFVCMYVHTCLTDILTKKCVKTVIRLYGQGDYILVTAILCPSILEVFRLLIN
jgi:hypothetical protein